MKKTLASVLFFSVMCFSTVFVSAGEYDLAAYLSMVERNNPNLLVLFKDIELAGTDVTLSRSMFLPRAAVQGGYTRNLTERFQSMGVASQPGGGPLVFQDVRSNYDNEIVLGAGISQVLFSAGALSNYNKAKLALAVREQSFEAARQTVLCAAKKLYLRAQLALLVVEIREASERFSKEQYQRVERRHSVGAATEMDLLLAEVDWRTKTDAVLEAEKNAELVFLAFRSLAGIPFSEVIVLAEEHTELPAIPETPNLNNILANRADYRALLLSRDLAAVERKASAKAFLPEVSASFTYALGGMGNGSSLVGDYDFHSAALGLTVSIPVLTGGARLVRMKAAKLEQEKATMALAQRETAIESELLELRLRLEDSARRFETSYRTVETARKAVELAQRAYVNGQITYLSVIETQDKLDMVWLGFVNVNFEYLSAYYDWEFAAGVR